MRIMRASQLFGGVDEGAGSAEGSPTRAARKRGNGSRGYSQRVLQKAWLNWRSVVPLFVHSLSLATLMDGKSLWSLEPQ